MLMSSHPLEAHSQKMAKKRKAGGQPKTPQKSLENPNKRVRMNVDSYEDVAGSDDDFHINRDKVLLGETSDAKRKRQWQEKGAYRGCTTQNEDLTRRRRILRSL